MGSKPLLLFKPGSTLVSLRLGPCANPLLKLVENKFVTCNKMYLLFSPSPVYLSAYWYLPLHIPRCCKLGSAVQCIFPPFPSLPTPFPVFLILVIRSTSTLLPKPEICSSTSLLST